MFYTPFGADFLTMASFGTVYRCEFDNKASQCFKLLHQFLLLKKKKEAAELHQQPSICYQPNQLNITNNLNISLLITIYQNDKGNVTSGYSVLEVVVDKV